MTWQSQKITSKTLCFGPDWPYFLRTCRGWAFKVRCLLFCFWLVTQISDPELPMQFFPGMKQKPMQIRCSLKTVITKSRKSLKAPNNKHPFRRNTSVMAAKFTRLVQNIAILWLLVTESCTGCRDGSFVYYGKWSLFVLRSIQSTKIHCVGRK
jgi:hypothetical protein